MTEDSNFGPGSHRESGDEVDIRQLCDCVAGGTCDVDARTSKTMHRIRLWWVHPDDPRDRDTIASPAQLDEWITTGVIGGASCPRCDDVAIKCPSFHGFLTAERWDAGDDA